jgi:hypothetical protein
VKRKIRTQAFVHMNGELVNVDTLDEQQRERFATALKLDYLNALYAGKAVFREAGND